MTSNVYARRYSQAIFRMAQESKEINLWQTDLRKITSLLKEKALFSLISLAGITPEEKTKAITQRLGEIHPMAIKLVLMLAAKGRLAMIDDIVDEFQALVDNYRGIEGTATAEVTTAIELDDEYQLKLAQRITEIVGKPVTMKIKVDPAIIGGIIIRVGDKLIDGSIRSKLSILKKDLGGVAK